MIKTMNMFCTLQKVQNLKCPNVWHQNRKEKSGLTGNLHAEHFTQVKFCILVPTTLNDELYFRLRVYKAAVVKIKKDRLDVTCKVIWVTNVYDRAGTMQVGSHLLFPRNGFILKMNRKYRPSYENL